MRANSLKCRQSKASPINMMNALDRTKYYMHTEMNYYEAPCSNDKLFFRNILYEVCLCIFNLNVQVFF